MRHGAVLAGALALTACGASPEMGAYVADGPRFVPERFFAGRGHGEATLKVILRRRVPVRVESEGRVARDGTLVLDQTIREGDKPARIRQWRIRDVGGGRYTGTLTDAVGPVTGTATGNRLTLRYTMRGGMKVRQALYLTPDGRAARNRLTVSKFGLRVAVLDERITKDE